LKESIKDQRVTTVKDALLEIVAKYKLILGYYAKVRQTKMEEYFPSNNNKTTEIL